MFVLGDDTYDRGKIPFVTFTLIALNFLFYCAQHRFGDRMTNGYAVVPKEITEFRDITTKQPVKVHAAHDFVVDEDGNVQVHGNGRLHYIHHFPGPVPIVLTLFSYMFLHGDIFHLLFNLWFLFIFGKNVECALDHGKFLGFYIFCGVVAGLAQVGADYDSVVPVVGASGAIAGIMGAYMAIMPWNNVKVVFSGIGFFYRVVELPAFLVVGCWFMGQLMLGMSTMHNTLAGGTAFWCHIGGFIAGFVTIKAWALFLAYQLHLVEQEARAERSAERDDALGDEPPLPVDELLADDIPTQAQFENMLDPVEAFKRSRQGVFRDVPENDPFDRPSNGPAVEEVVKKAPIELEQGIVASLPKPRRPLSGV